MVNNSSTGLDATFAALADPTRRALLTRLTVGESSVMRLAAPFAVSLPAITKHLGVLERAGLISSRRQGRVRRVQLVAGPMKDAARWIARYRRFWQRQLDRLAAYLTESPAPPEESPWPKARKQPPSRFTSGVRSRRRGKGSSRPGPGRKI